MIPQNRRTLIAGAAASLLAPGLADAAKPPGPIIVNALGGLDNPNLGLNRSSQGAADTSRPDVDDRAIREAKASGLTAVNITLGYVSGPQDPYEYTIRTIGVWDQLLRERGADLIRIERASDLQRARREGKVGVIYGFQNMAQVGDKLDRIDTFARLGVRVMQLTYNPANQIGDGSMAPENRGLTPFGREVVARINANKAMVDLSHSGERTCLDAIAASTRPISINHTGCRAVTDLPRNKTDAELRGVAEKGGFVGVYFMPFTNLSGHAHAEDVVAHIAHAVEVCGEDHVGIGTDGGVTTIDDLGQYQAHLTQEITERRAAGISATGERPDTYPFVVDLRGPEQFHKLARLLKAKGYSSGRVEKILGQNYLGFAREIWG